MPARVATYPSSSAGRYAIGLVVVALSLMGAAVLAGFVASFLWPPQSTLPQIRTISVGASSHFKLNEPHFLVVTSGGKVFDTTYAAPSPSSKDTTLARFWLVRTSDDHFVAINWKDPRGCTIPWRPDFQYESPLTHERTKGWFRDPCGGSTYDIQGRKVFGPSPRDLDHYQVSFAGSNVLVKVGDGALIRGLQHSYTEPLVQY